MDESSTILDFVTRAELIALAILIAGFIIARLAAVAIGGIFGAIDRRAARMTTTSTSVMSPRLIRYSRAFIFWFVLLLSVALSLQVLGVGGIGPTVDAVIGFTPKILVAFAIVVAGYLLGLLCRHLLPRLSDGLSADSIGPKLAHGTIVAIAIVMGLQHINVNITFVTRLILILAATVSGGLMLAFALGARQHVANLLARRELGRLTIGERVRIGDVEGWITDIYSTGVDIETNDGVASVPAARLVEVGLLRLNEGDTDE